MSGAWGEWLEARRKERRAARLSRSLRPLDADDGLHAHVDGRRVTLFSTNDYLGLSSHPAVREAAAEAARRHGMGPRGSSLVCGHTDLHEDLAVSVARVMGTEAVLLCPTGYAANLSVISSFAGPGVTVFSDALNHASIIDGCRLANRRGAEVKVYRHRDMEHLEALIREHPCTRRILVTDAVFSMDGDLAPLAALADLKDRHDALLVVDEAHAMLVFGDRGSGLAEHLGLADRVDVRIGTLGKAIGAQGGFVSGSREIVDHVLNEGRPQIYSTSLPLPVVAAARAALGVFEAEPERRRRLFCHVARLGQCLGREPESPILPVILGTEERALAAAATLESLGFLVPAIRPPTVPEGTSRLRVTLSAGHTDDEVAAFASAILESCRFS